MQPLKLIRTVQVVVCVWGGAAIRWQLPTDSSSFQSQQ